MAGLGKHIKGHGVAKVLHDKVAHKPHKDLQSIGSGQMSAPDMTSQTNPDLMSQAGPDMSGQASTAGSPYMGGMSVGGAGAPAGGMPGMKTGGRVKKHKR
jgi:hypothetical protein